MTSLDLREQFIDLPLQPVITRDNVTANVDSVVYWMITDPVRSVYEINDLVGSIMQVTLTGIRSVMANMDLDETLSSRDEISSKLRVILDDATDKWGVKVTRVDVKNINPPEEVLITMEKQMTAERNRRALVLEAEGDREAVITRAQGDRQSAITRSEGHRQSTILEAEGAAEARLRTADAEASAIAKISEAVGSTSRTAQYLLNSRYIESLKSMAASENSKVVFMPVETSTLLSSVNSIEEILLEGKSNIPRLATRRNKYEED